MSYLSGIYLESWFSWFEGGMKITLKKKKKTDREKIFKYKEKKKQRIQGKSNNNNKRLWFYLLYKYIYIARKHSLKKQFIWSHCIYSFLGLQGIWNAVTIHQSSYGFALVSGPHDLEPKVNWNKLN